MFEGETKKKRIRKFRCNINDGKSQSSQFYSCYANRLEHDWILFIVIILHREIIRKNIKSETWSSGGEIDGWTKSNEILHYKIISTNWSNWQWNIGEVRSQVFHSNFYVIHGTASTMNTNYVTIDNKQYMSYGRKAPFILCTIHFVCFSWFLSFDSNSLFAFCCSHLVSHNQNNWIIHTLIRMSNTI